MSWSFRSRNTFQSRSTRALTTSGPVALNSSSPTFATPNHGSRSRATRRAITRSSVSKASARRSRAVAVMVSGMGCSDQVGDTRDAGTLAPASHFGKDAYRGTRVGEGGGPHLHRVGAGLEEFDGVDAARHPADADDRRARERGTALVHGAHRDGVQRRAREPPSADRQPRLPRGGIDGEPH